MNSYYNTNKEKGEVLKESNRRAESLESEILELFRSSNDGECGFSPELVHELIRQKGRPITSVRRALTNLTNQGYLIKTNHMVNGDYGKKVHTWRIKK